MNIAKLLLSGLSCFYLLGCGGGGSSPNRASANPFAGTFIGSNYSSDGTIGSDNITISSTGSVGGRVINTAGQTFTISGSIDSQGSSKITLTLTGGSSVTTSGTLGFNAAKELTGTLTRSSGITDTITVTDPKSALEYAGTYSGAYSTTANGTGTVTQLIISTSGVISGSSVSATGITTAYSGVVSSDGVVSIGFTQPGGATGTEGGFLGFNSSGELVSVSSNSLDTATLTLAQKPQ